jgi:hypothetical protein
MIRIFTASTRVHLKMTELLKTNAGTVEQVTSGKYFDNNHNVKESKFWLLTLYSEPSQSGLVRNYIETV